MGKADPTIGRADRDVELCFDLGLIKWDNVPEAIEIFLRMTEGGRRLFFRAGWRVFGFFGGFVDCSWFFYA